LALAIARIDNINLVGSYATLMMHVVIKMPAGKQTIAIVEDDASLNRALERLLQASGFATQAFLSAEDFLANSHPESHACFILDIHLPGISGVELFYRLCERGGRPPVIFITAGDGQAVRQNASLISGTICLRKPLVAAELLGALHEQLRCSGSGPE
jgi:FixJ family two-component response regulator